MIVRLAKITLIASIALLMTLIALNNLTDYGSNFAFVQHVMSMDTTFPNNKGLWRAITTPSLHHVFLCRHHRLGDAIGCSLLDRSDQMFRARSGGAVEFHRAKDVAMGGLTLVCCYLRLCSLPLAGSGF